MTDEELKEMKKKLTRIFSEKKMKRSDFNELESMGFRVVEGKTHNKLYYKNSQGFVTCSKSLSDSNHGGKNLVSVTMKLVREIESGINNKEIKLG